MCGLWIRETVRKKGKVNILNQCGEGKKAGKNKVHACLLISYKALVFFSTAIDHNKLTRKKEEII